MIDNVMALLLLLNLALTVSSRLSTCIALLAVQGMAIGLLPLFGAEGVTWRGVGLAALTVLVKGVAFPRLLRRAVRVAAVRREVEPFVGYGMSLTIGTILVVASFWLGGRLSLPAVLPGQLVLPGAIGSILTGLFLVVSRRKAVMQVIGYLAMENGIAAFGLAAVSGTALLVELGVLLDAFVAVLAMAIVICHISREFDHIDADRLSSLRG